VNVKYPKIAYFLQKTIGMEKKEEKKKKKKREGK